MSTLEYAAEVIIVLFVYLFSEYVLIPMVIKPFSNTLRKRLTQYLPRYSHYLTGSKCLEIATAKVEDIPYLSHHQNSFKSSYYTLTAMTPMSAGTNSLSDQSLTPAMVKYIPFTSSPGLVSKYLDDCEADRCTSATSLPLMQYEKVSTEEDVNGNMQMLCASTLDSTPFISSPSLVNKLFDECEAGRECDSSFHSQSMAYGNTFKPLPRRVVLLWGQRF